MKKKNFVPDFIAKVKTPGGDIVNLIVEVSGWSNDETGHKAEKRRYTTDYWLPAVNALGKYDRWVFIEISDIDNIKPLLLQKINTL